MIAILIADLIASDFPRKQPNATKEHLRFPRNYVNVYKDTCFARML